MPWLRSIGILCWSTLLILVLACAKDGSRHVEEGFVEQNDVYIYYKTIGKGEPIVILHGGPGLDHTYLLPQMSELARKHRLIFFDQRLSGRSTGDLDSSQISIQHFVRDIESVRQTLKLGRMNLMGHSWGGLLAMYYAISYPQNLKSLILTNTTPASFAEMMNGQQALGQRFTPEDSLARAQIMESDTFKKGEVSAYEDFYRVLFRAQFYDRDLADSLTLTFPENFLDNSRKLQHLFKELTDYDIHAELNKVSCPTLVIHGDHEPVPLEARSRIAEEIPNAGFVALKNCGHFPYIDAPQEFFGEIREFLDGI